MFNSTVKCWSASLQVLVSAMLMTWPKVVALGCSRRHMARISKELVDFNRSTDADRAGITLETVKESLANLRATIRGPTGTPYEGGVFVVQITVPSTYPFEPPKMKFETRVWHPNVSSQTGAICLSTLKDDW